MLTTGVVIANEFADALPVHRVIQLDGALREIHVDWRDDRFIEVAGPLTDDRLATWFADAAIELAEGQRAEVNLAMLDWIRDVSAGLERGFVIVIDYGAAARELYGPDRPTGTIRAFSGQQVSGDVLSGVGARDITSHVDFDALEREARACGLIVVGRRRSNEFLIACGLDDAYQQARAVSDQRLGRVDDAAFSHPAPARSERPGRLPGQCHGQGARRSIRHCAGLPRSPVRDEDRGGQVPARTLSSSPAGHTCRHHSVTDRRRRGSSRQTSALRRLKPSRGRVDPDLRG